MVLAVVSKTGSSGKPLLLPAQKKTLPGPPKPPPGPPKPPEPLRINRKVWENPKELYENPGDV